MKYLANFAGHLLLLKTLSSQRNTLLVFMSLMLMSERELFLITVFICLDRRQLNCCYVRNILHNKVTPCMIITMKVKFISSGLSCKLCYFYSIIQSLTYCFVCFQDQFDGHQRKGRFLGRTSEQRAKNSMKLKRM